jgi:hypothetical protein
MESSLDFTDLIRGEGDWMNMQEIVRKTFKICFDQIQKQNEQITKLAGNYASLKVKLSSRPDFDEITKMMECKQKKPIKIVSHDDLERISHVVVNIRADLERKASINYVDDSLRRKVDKSDILVHNLSKMTATQYAGDISALHSDIESIKLRVDSKTQMATNSLLELKSLCSGELSGLRAQIGHLEAQVGMFATKSEMHSAVDRKVGTLIH